MFGFYTTSYFMQMPKFRRSPLIRGFPPLTLEL